MSTAYVIAEKLSPNLSFTPEGFLLARSVIVSRTGWQDYQAHELGLAGAGPVHVYRDSTEVFSKKAMASGETKPVTILHPSQFVTPHTTDAIKGVMVNLHRGPQLPDGNEGLLADLILWDPVAIDEVLSGRLRQCSLGYRCTYKPLGEDRYAQTDLILNHLALVAQARGGTEIAIQDSMTEEGEMDKQLREDLAAAIASVKEVLAKRGGEQGRTLREARDVTRLSGSTAGPFEFAEELKRTNLAYAGYDSDQEAGAKWAEENRRAGREMQERTLAQAKATGSR